MMDFLKLAADRYSVRKFKSEPVKQEEIELILKAGHLAPTGCNIQPQRILVINDDNSLAKLKNCTKCHFDAPLAMLVCYDKGECWERKYDGKNCGVADACIVTTHMMLQAHTIGVGSTWVMSFNPDEICKEFDVPKNYRPVALLVMGYPADDVEPAPMHSQYRPMDEVVFYNKF